MAGDYGSDSSCDPGWSYRLHPRVPGRRHQALFGICVREL